VKGEIITQSGKVFRLRHKELLDSMPEDIVAELAKRRLKELEKNKSNASASEKSATG
jgi:hypothetical protein